MGWTYSEAWPTATAMRDELRRGFGDRLLGDATTNYGRHYYAAIKPPDGPATMFVALLDKDGKGWWGYKDMDESMGPYVHDCPLALLDKLGEPPNEWAAKWRDKVRAYHARRKANVVAVKTAKPGDKVWAGREEPYTVAYKRKNTLIAYRHDGAGPYRIPTARISKFEAA